MDDWGLGFVGFFLPPSDMLTHLCENPLKDNIIKPHPVTYLKNYLFKEWTYIKRKRIQKEREKSLTDIGSAEDRQLSQTHLRLLITSSLRAGCQQLCVPTACCGLWPFFAKQPRTFWSLAVCTAISSDPQILWHPLWVLLSWDAWKVVSVQVMGMKG